MSSRDPDRDPDPRDVEVPLKMCAKCIARSRARFLHLTATLHVYDKECGKCAYNLFYARNDPARDRRWARW